MLNKTTGHARAPAVYYQKLRYQRTNFIRLIIYARHGFREYIQRYTSWPMMVLLQGEH